MSTEVGTLHVRKLESNLYVSLGMLGTIPNSPNMANSLGRNVRNPLRDEAVDLIIQIADHPIQDSAKRETHTRVRSLIWGIYSGPVNKAPEVKRNGRKPAPAPQAQEEKKLQLDLPSDVEADIRDRLAQALKKIGFFPSQVTSILGD